MGNTDFSVPQRMSLSAFIVIYIKTLSNLVGPFIFLILFNVINSDSKADIARTLTGALVGLAIFLVLGLLIAFCSYYFKRFYVKNGNLIVIHGGLHRQTSVIPLDKIHTLRTKQGFAYRILGMRGVSFDTLASKEEEVELILDEHDWKALLSCIEHQESVPTEAKLAAKSADILRFSNLNLLKGALCQNHLKGVILLMGALFVIYDKISEIDDKVSDNLLAYLSNQAENIQPTVLNVVCVFLIIYVLGFLFFIGKVYLRYYDMEVQTDKEQLTFKSGLVSRLSSRLSFDKVCAIIVKRNAVERLLSCCTVQLRQAINATAEDRDFQIKIYGSNSFDYFLRWWLGATYTSSPVIISAKSGNGVFFSTVMFDFLISLTAIVLLCYFELFAWVIVPAVYIVISIVKGILAKRRSSITLTETYMVINNGQLANKENYVKYNNIETVRMVHTPFTPIFHRVNLVLDTSGTTFTVRSLDERQASIIYELLLAR